MDQVVYAGESTDQDIFVKCHLTIKDLTKSLCAYFEIS
jgi:hypothetical protein